jgi:DNA-binding NarL/FixJ family response regulator
MMTLTDLKIRLEKFTTLPRIRNTAIHFEDIPPYRFHEMSSKQLVVFYLFYDKGMRNGEIAKHLGITPGGVRKHLRQAEIYYARSFHNEESSRHR